MGESQPGNFWLSKDCCTAVRSHTYNVGGVYSEAAQNKDPSSLMKDLCLWTGQSVLSAGSGLTCVQKQPQALQKADTV